MDEHAAWHDQDAFWALVEPFLFTMRRMALATVQVEQIITLLDLEPGARVLDLPCGNGRHSLELAARGLDVTGVDRTARYLEAARGAAEQRGLAVDFQVGDMRLFRRPQRFDVVLNLFGSFGYFADPADDLRVIRNWYDSLRPGGRLLIETAGKEILARNFQPRDWFQEGDLLVLVERRPTHNWRRIETRYIVFRAGQRQEHTVSIRSYSAAELAALMAEGGFSNVQVYGSLDGRDYDQEAERLVVIGRKAEG